MGLKAGKLPADMLSRFTGSLGREDPSGALIVGPSVGEDTAAIEPGPATDELLVITSDPITFTANNIGAYAVTINANDIATAGARPKWFFATVLLPTGVASERAADMLEELRAACRAAGVAPAGGHTEITDAVNRPVVSGTLIGTVARDRHVDKRRMASGDRILVTKEIAVEGSAILADECARTLTGGGLDASCLGRAREEIDRLSIVGEAEAAVGSCETGAVSAMHDVTEGGIATALSEFARFGRLEIDLDAIPISEHCLRICEILGIDPLGLIGSGSLLIACRAAAEESVVRAVTAAGVRCTPIGNVIDGVGGVRWTRSGITVAGPSFEVDEITRVAFG
jgi:hydrogenase expression/formation protein HypE